MAARLWSMQACTTVTREAPKVACQPVVCVQPSRDVEALTALTPLTPSPPSRLPKPDRQIRQISRRKVVQSTGHAKRAFAPAQRGPLKHGTAISPAAPQKVSDQPGKVVVVSPPRRPLVIAKPVLWTLECIFANGMQLNTLPKESRVVAHRRETSNDSLPTQRVGRLFQQSFFDSLVMAEEDRDIVAREHFQIWAEEAEQQPSAGSNTARLGRRLCAFYLTNYSPNGTSVNGRVLNGGGQQIRLHGGDTIAFARRTSVDGNCTARTLAPFLELRFDLSGSILGDAPLLTRRVPSVSLLQCETPSAGPVTERGSGSTPYSPEHGLPVVRRSLGASRSLGPLGSRECDEAVRASALLNCADIEANAGGGVSFLGVEPQPLFALELGGAAVRGGLAAKDRRIVHGPPRSAGGGPCPPLLLGRTQQPKFWQNVLSAEAFNALSRHHVQIEVYGEGSPRSSAVFHARNLSEAQPIRICSSASLEDIEAVRPLAVGERSPLAHGNIIVLNPSHGSSVKLLFLDLTVQGSLPNKGLSATVRKPTLLLYHQTMANPQQPD
mmetsp:Transcript_71739/g.138638  ORF Transcript_71739/g.138638 Transcript_71739/m.138638 type:complete len:552 (+) Transcript_71739:73-1728(+)